MTLAALRHRIGHDDFAHLLRAWTSRHRHGHGTHGGVRGTRHRAQRPGPDVVLRRLAGPADPAGRDRRQRARELSRAAARRSSRSGSPARCGASSWSAQVIARRPALIPSQRSGSGSQDRRAVPDPGQPGEVGVAAEDEVGEGAAGEVGGAHAVADVAAGPAEPGGRVEADRGRPVAGDAERAAPGVGDRARRRSTGNRSTRVLCSAAKTPLVAVVAPAGSASRSGTAPRGRRRPAGRRRCAGRR